MTPALDLFRNSNTPYMEKKNIILSNGNRIHEFMNILTYFSKWIIHLFKFIDTEYMYRVSKKYIKTLISKDENAKDPNLIF